MGNAFATIISSLIEMYNKIAQKVYSFKSKKRDYYQSEILLKDEENQADLLSNEDIKGTIKNRKNVEAKNEYHLIKCNDENDNMDSNIVNHEIEDLQKELHQMNMENEIKTDRSGYGNMDELKVQILENESLNNK